MSDEHEQVIVENGEGEGVVDQPLPTITTTKPLTEDDLKAFRSAFGSWADVDTESLKKAIYESRQSPRPPVRIPDLTLY
jgi:hypothetical protein